MTDAELVAKLWHILLAAAGALSLLTLLYVRFRGMAKSVQADRESHAQDLAAEAIRRAEIERRLTTLEANEKDVSTHLSSQHKEVLAAVGELRECLHTEVRRLEEKSSGRTKGLYEAIEKNRVEFSERLDRLQKKS